MAFELKRTLPVAPLNLTFEHYVDSRTGAEHIHLAAESDENVFLVAFPTMPDTDDGRAHILEHLALCGSRNFPVRDPFFSMLRRSLATFMNAMTYADRTVYPFATQDRKDFFNLLSVYLDAAFHPTLDYLDFRQEGWRVEINAKGEPEYHGVVFNEMKGAMADPTRAVWKGMEERLKSGTTYARESGGDPVAIPDLTHDELLRFHQTHYNPAQAVFMSYGNIPAVEIQLEIEEKVLAACQGSPAPRMIPQTSSLSGISETTIAVPAQPGAHGGQHGIQIAWLLGDSCDMAVRFKAKLLEKILLSDSASPINHAIESAGFGQSADIVGSDDSEREITFHLGMSGLQPDEVGRARELLETTLQTVASEGVPARVIDNVLRDLEIEQKEISGSRTPYGLQLLLQMVPLAMNGGDPIEELDLTGTLAKLREEAAKEGFVQGLMSSLVDNPRKVVARIEPDLSYSSKMDEAIRQKLTVLASSEKFNPGTHEQEAASLKERQRATPDLSCLPRIHPSEVEREPVPTLPVDWRGSGSDAGPALALIEAPTNGVATLTVQIWPIPSAQENWVGKKLPSATAMRAPAFRPISTAR